MKPRGRWCRPRPTLHITQRPWQTLVISTKSTCGLALKRSFRLRQTTSSEVSGGAQNQACLPQPVELLGDLGVLQTQLRRELKERQRAYREGGQQALGQGLERQHVARQQRTYVGAAQPGAGRG
jgi:hypothetical protein